MYSLTCRCLTGSVPVLPHGLAHPASTSPATGMSASPLGPGLDIRAAPHPPGSLFHSAIYSPARQAVFKGLEVRTRSPGRNSLYPRELAGDAWGRAKGRGPAFTPGSLAGLLSPALIHTVFDGEGCPKVRQTEWLKQQRAVVSDLEAASPRSRRRQGRFLLRVEGSICFRLLSLA